MVSCKSEVPEVDGPGDEPATTGQGPRPGRDAKTSEISAKRDPPPEIPALINEYPDSSVSEECSSDELEEHDSISFNDLQRDSLGEPTNSLPLVLVGDITRVVQARLDEQADLSGWIGFPSQLNGQRHICEGDWR